MFLVGLAPKIQIARASGTIYIRVDGSVDPPTAPIEWDGSVYTFRGNASDSIVVEKDDIVIDGAGYSVQGAGIGIGIDLSGRSNVTVENTRIKGFENGVYLYESSNNTIHGNHIANSSTAIRLEYSSGNNSVSGNNMTANTGGISVGPDSSGNKIYGNSLVRSGCGISLDTVSSNNGIWENSIADGVLGISLSTSSNYNSMVGNNIANNTLVGIELLYCSNNSIHGNNITNDDLGISLEYSSDNNITGNNIANNRGGLNIRFKSSYNIASGNNIVANTKCGITLDYEAENNSIIHNNFLENQQHARAHPMSHGNFWDNGVEGNLWSNYIGVDLNHDGVGDTPYLIEANDTDHCPLMGMFHDFTVPLASYPKTEHVEVISNSTVSSLELGAWLTSPNQYFQPGQPFITIYVDGENGTQGFCRLMIPRAALNISTYLVLVDGQPVNATELPISNNTHAYLYFTYVHSKHEVIVTIPEFPLILIIPIFMIATLLTAMAHRGKRIRQLVQLYST